MTLGRNVNTVTETNTVNVQLNASTAVPVFAANKKRTVVIFSSLSNQDYVIKEQAASVDNLKEGIAFSAGHDPWATPNDNVYQGAISAIAINGNPTINAVERLS